MSHQSGNIRGWKPQFKDGKIDQWEDIEVKQGHYPRGTVVTGEPYPLLDGAILMQAWLLGHAQAWAIAWDYAANHAAVNYREVEVRIVEFEVKFSIDCEAVT